MRMLASTAGAMSSKQLARLEQLDGQIQEPTMQRTQRFGLAQHAQAQVAALHAGAQNHLHSIRPAPRAPHRHLNRLLQRLDDDPHGPMYINMYDSNDSIVPTAAYMDTRSRLLGPYYYASPPGHSQPPQHAV